MNIGQTIITVDSSHWEPVIVPTNQTGAAFVAKSVDIINALLSPAPVDCNRRIISDDAATQFPLLAGWRETFEASHDPRNLSGYSAWKTGDTVAYVRAIAGSCDIAVVAKG